MKIEQIYQSLCPQEVVGHFRNDDGLQFICSRSLYPNGDTITAFLQPISPDVWGFTDEGITATLLDRAGVELSDRRTRAIRFILNAHNMEQRGDRLVRFPVTKANASCSFREFCDGILRISSMEFEHELTERELYVPKVDAVLRRAAGKRFDVRQKYIDEQHDQDKLYPIDWAIFRQNCRKHVFAITGHDSVLTMPAAVHYFRNSGLVVPTLAVVSPHIKLTKRNTARISHACQEMLFRDVYENEERIRQWLEAA